MERQITEQDLDLDKEAVKNMRPNANSSMVLSTPSQGYILDPISKFGNQELMI